MISFLPILFFGLRWVLIVFKGNKKRTTAMVLFKSSLEYNSERWWYCNTKTLKQYMLWKYYIGKVYLNQPLHLDFWVFHSSISCFKSNYRCSDFLFCSRINYFSNYSCILYTWINLIQPWHHPGGRMVVLRGLITL